MKKLGFAFSLATIGLFATVATAADAPNHSVLLSGLNNPCGVAVQPGTGHVFVSDSAAGRVVRVNPESAGEAIVVITGFPKDIYGKGPKYDIGPLGLAFLNENTLVVGGGGFVDGKELMRIYSVPAAGKSITADEMQHKLGPLGPSDATLKGEGNFYGVATNGQAIYITCNGDDTKGWISKIDLENGQPGVLKPFIKTKEATDVDAPVGITISGDGQLVVSQMGEMNVPHDSLLTMYDAASGKLAVKATTGLFDIAGLAYSPKSGHLFAVDYAWMQEDQGGLFRLDVPGAEAASTKAHKIAMLNKPSALAFAPDGSLYVTIFGKASDSSDEKPGKLIRFAPGL